MSEGKPSGYLPYVVIAVLCYALATQQTIAPKPGPDEPKPVVVSPSKTLDACYLADRSSKLAILKAITAAKDATDEQKLKLFNDQSEAKRTKDFQPYVDLVGDALAAGNLDELVSKLQAKK